MRRCISPSISFSEMVADQLPENKEERISLMVLKEGGTSEDLLLLNQITEYVLKKRVYGASSLELKVSLYNKL